MNGNRNIVWVYRDGPREAEAPLEPKLVNYARGNNKGFSWYRVSNCNFKENVVLLMIGLGDLVATEAKAFTGKVCSQAFLVRLPNRKVWESRLSICLVLWTHVTNEANETAGQHH